jgi:hypothetical protein
LQSGLDIDLRIKVYGVRVDVTLLYFDDCPNWKVADSHLSVLAFERPELNISRQVVDTPEEAARTGFRGSPSILIDGRDAFADAGDPVGLSCRMYRTPDGVEGSPTLTQLREVLDRG